MSLRTILVILLALGCGVSSALGFNLMLAGQRRSPEQVDTVKLVIAKAAIPRGRLVAANLVEVKEWPKSLAPSGALTTLDEVLERAALQTMLPGEPIFEAKLAAKGAIGGMASIIPSGKRAYTIQTKTSASKVAGFVLPGNLVDVLLTFRGQTNDETGGGSTTTLLQAVEVLAVGKQIEPVGQVEVVDAQEIESVTLLVTPEQVAKLDLGQSLGMLSLSLRNPNDLDEAKTSPATIADIRFSRSTPVDPTKLFGLLGSVASAFRGALPNRSTMPVASPQPAAPPPAPKKPELASTSILTLRGQTWGAIHVTVPEKEVSPASRSGQ